MWYNSGTISCSKGVLISYNCFYGSSTCSCPNYLLESLERLHTLCDNIFLSTLIRLLVGLCVLPPQRCLFFLKTILW